MKIFLAADHAGFTLKEELKSWLKDQDYQVVDEGAFENNPADDYPDFVRLAALEVSSDPDSRGLILGATGQGEAMVANRFAGVRAAVYYGGSVEVLTLSRQHNRANILSLGARFLTTEEAKEAVKIWLATDFSGAGRHRRRIAKIDNHQPEILQL